jgi:predicted phosphodiesterase
MRILAFSDVIEWEGYEELVSKIKPEMIVLGGDLVSDGFASFQLRGPAYRKIHVQRFYRFLRYAGKKSQVIIVKGDHDEEFKGDYKEEIINKISGCSEISGKVIEINSYHFLGLGAREAHNTRLLQRLIKNLKEKVDIVLMHGENIRIVSLLKPKLIIKGGWATGACMVNNIPSIFTGPDGISIIELKNKRVSEISQFRFSFSETSKKIILKKITPCIPPFYEKFKWVLPLKLSSSF